jgi:hypothetical protein
MTSRNFEQPGDLPVTDGSGRVQPVWSQWFTRVHNAVSSVYQSGSTANRPTSLLWVGRPYFDTDLGKPVWVKAAKPAVWVDATGAVV